MSLGLQMRASPRMRTLGAIKLARLLKASETEFESEIKKIESAPLFQKLLTEGIIQIIPYAGAAFRTGKIEGPSPRSSDGLPEILDGKGEMIPVIQKIGQEHFERYFLGDENFSVAETSLACGITLDEAVRLKELVNRLYIQSEFESPSDNSEPRTVFSTVARIEIAGGRPALAFFNREIWKGRYQIDANKRSALEKSLPPGESTRLERMLRQLEILETRKSTLYRVLEALIAEQAEFLVSGDRNRLHILTQKTLADRLDINPGLLNRLISNKAVQLPWGLTAPLKLFFINRKAVLKNELCGLMASRSRLPDRELARIIRDLFSHEISRRTVAQYRLELTQESRPALDISLEVE